MKVKSFPGPRFLAATAAQGRYLLRTFGHLVVERKLFGLLLLLAAALLLFLLLPYDERLLATLHFWHRQPEIVARRISYFLGTWGDYPTYNLPLALAIWTYGVWKKNRKWRRIGLVCFFGATFAGLFADCFRLTVGRARPDSHLMDGFYGLKSAWRGGYQSFPSGHAASVFGTAISLLIVCRPLGIITTMYAVAVVWARVELNRHYPTDVIVGSLIGMYFGALFGWAARSLSLDDKKSIANLS